MNFPAGINLESEAKAILQASNAPAAALFLEENAGQIGALRTVTKAKLLTLATAITPTQPKIIRSAHPITGGYEEGAWLDDLTETSPIPPPRKLSSGFARNSLWSSLHQRTPVDSAADRVTGNTARRGTRGK